jgi:hypothetical protein
MRIEDRNATLYARFDTVKHNLALRRSTLHRHTFRRNSNPSLLQRSSHSINPPSSIVNLLSSILNPRSSIFDRQFPCMILPFDFPPYSSDLRKDSVSQVVRLLPNWAFGGRRLWLTPDWLQWAMRNGPLRSCARKASL